MIFGVYFCATVFNLVFPSICFCNKPLVWLADTPGYGSTILTSSRD